MKKKGKAREYNINHRCGHTYRLEVWCSMSSQWLKEEADRDCPECREVSK